MSRMSKTVKRYRPTRNRVLAKWWTTAAGYGAAMPLRTTDLRRHLDDVRSRTHEGRQSCKDKAALCGEEVQRLDPVVR